MDLDSLTVDRAALEEGVWLAWRGSRFRVASTRSETYIRAIERWARRAAAQRRKAAGEDPDADGPEAARADRELAGIWADTLLLDWRGVTAKHGQEPAAYSREAAIRAITSIPDFADWLYAQAQNDDHFRAPAPEAAGPEDEDAPVRRSDPPPPEDEGAEANTAGKALRRSLPQP